MGTHVSKTANQNLRTIKHMMHYFSVTNTIQEISYDFYRILTIQKKLQHLTQCHINLTLWWVICHGNLLLKLHPDYVLVVMQNVNKSWVWNIQTDITIQSMSLRCQEASCSTCSLKYDTYRHKIYYISCYIYV